MNFSDLFYKKSCSNSELNADTTILFENLDSSEAEKGLEILTVIVGMTFCSGYVFLISIVWIHFHV